MDICRHFEEYSRSFLTGNADDDRSILLKIEHTGGVVSAADEIAGAEKFSPQESRLLHTAALLHDYSRFEQYRMYRTFRDRDSFDHGRRSAELIRLHRLLDEDFTAAERGIILGAVKVHNLLSIPANMTGTARLIAGAVRDADKLDIMQRVLEHFANPENCDVVWGMPNAPCLSPEAERQLLKPVSPDNSILKNATDFGAAKFNWVYDLNTRHSRRKYLELDLPGQLRSFLPAGDAIDEICRRAQEYLRRNV